MLIINPNSRSTKHNDVSKSLLTISAFLYSPQKISTLLKKYNEIPNSIFSLKNFPTQKQTCSLLTLQDCFLRNSR